MIAARRSLAWGNMIEAHYAGHVAVRVPGRTGRLFHYMIDNRYTVAARHALDALEVAGRILPDDDNEQASLAS